MSRATRHGLTFTLFPSPDDDLWMEIVRDHDGAILHCEKFDGADGDFHRAVESWFDDIITEVVNEMDFEACQGCGGRRSARMYDEDGCVLIEDEVMGVEWRWDLCTPCAQHLIRTNPWVLKQ
ncbi:MAG: hypothetical protein RLZ14_344 [Actinomycetota bacterium]|jgi:hypothetical protein